LLNQARSIQRRASAGYEWTQTPSLGY